VWGLPAVPAKAVAAGTALVGDFTSGCMLIVREGVNVRASGSDRDDFVRNRVTLLGEGRSGPAIWQPAAFATVDLAP
jgi:HK97 family phage major capsid protein